jgi:TATA-box binding protein (TBP) (component of TFIID and TFIIIB)
MESINHINRPLQISTITACANAKNVVINLQKIYDHLEPSETVRYIELGNCNKGYAKKNNKKKRKKKPVRQFFNQLTLIIYCNTYNKLVNVKIFLSGAIQLTGLKSKLGALKIIKYCESLINTINIINTITTTNTTNSNTNTPSNIDSIPTTDQVIKFSKDQETLIYDPPKIVLINSDFTLFSNESNSINRNELYKIVINNTRVFASYEPCIYPGVNIKYYYNKYNRKENGICYCKDRCCGKGGAECKRVTIVVFQSSKVIITGANNYQQLMMAFIWIKRLIFDNLDKILVKNE